MGSREDDTLTAPGFVSFVTEFFHEDHNQLNERHIVAVGNGAVAFGLRRVAVCTVGGSVLTPRMARDPAGPPRKDVRSILEDSRYQRAVTYVDGDVVNEAHLERCGALTAKAAFLLGDKNVLDTAASDSSSIVRAVAMKRFVHSRTGRDLFTCVALHSTDNKQLLLSSCLPYSQPILTTGQSSALRTYKVAAHMSSGALALKPPATLSVVAEELKLNLLAQACQCPGFPAVVYNLVSSSSDTQVSPRRRAGSCVCSPTRRRSPRFWFLCLRPSCVRLVCRPSPGVQRPAVAD